MAAPRISAAALALALGTALAQAPAAPVRAETYTVLLGSVEGSEGRTHALEGRLEASFPPSLGFGPEPPPALLVSDFELRAGDLVLTPRPPINYQGIPSFAYLEIANQLVFDRPAVEFLLLRAGGELLAESGSEVTFGFLELRGDATDGGRVVGHRQSGDYRPPRRLELAGRLVEVEQTFRLPLADECTPVRPDGGIVGGGVIISFDAFDITEGETVGFTQPDSVRIRSRVSAGSSSTIEGELVESGSLLLLAPAPIVLGPVANALAPTLEQLGITAPSGATVVYESGALTVTSEGDLYVSGDGISTLPGIVDVALVAGGAIVIEAGATLQVDGSIALTAGIRVEIAGDANVSAGGGEIVSPPSVPVLCGSLIPVFPRAERELGTFSLVATSAEPMAIDVRPGDARNRVNPGSRQRLPVAILGSEQLDPRDLDPRSPRLGPGEAAPRAISVPRGRGRSTAGGDWLGLFSLRDTGIAFGDEFVCLLAERRAGDLLEGCDAIDTLPRRRRH